MPLHWKIAIGFVAGLALGLVVHYGVGADAGWVQTLTKYLTQPFSTLFLSLIFMLIVPLLFSANDCLDIGLCLGGSVSLDYYDKAPFPFNGDIDNVNVRYTS